MVITIMELQTVFNAKYNVMRVHRHQHYVYHVTELIGFHGHHLIIFASKYNFIKNRCTNGYFENGVANCVQCEN